MRLSKTTKHVSSARGGSTCAKCVRDRIKPALLTEEQKIVKVLKVQAQQIQLAAFADSLHTTDTTTPKL
ncbi:60S ribosomal protein L34 [Plecturocebus cupreus]